MKDNIPHRKRFWVVSPNVRFDSSTVSKWRQASVKWKAAFMGWNPNDRGHKQIGYKFAHIVQPGDILLIARRHHKRPEVVGFGVVDGTFKRSLKGFRPPQSFGSLRELKPFRPLSEAPPKLRIMDALGQVAALRELRPDGNANHRIICRWLERKLVQKANASNRRISNLKEEDVRLADLPSENELEYQVRTRRKVRLAKKTEAKLMSRYREWLENQQRRLFIAKYKNLRCDAYEKERGNLIEAKSSAKREYLRMAVGQLLDYAYLGRKILGTPNMAILLPERPDAKSVEWLSGLHISVAWKEKDVFLDNANGLFT